MTALLDYLASLQAIEDVRALFALSRSPTGGTWLTDQAGQWQRVTLCRDGVEVVVYFRSDGPPRCPQRHGAPCTGAGSHWGVEEQRFIVTDLGEAVRALRLRTGWFEAYINDGMLRRLRSLIPDEVDAEVSPEGVVYAIGTDNGLTVPAPDLAAAIVRVLAASVRVAGLEG